MDFEGHLRTTGGALKNWAVAQFQDSLAVGVLCRECEGKHEIGYKKDKAQPKILPAKKDPIPTCICHQQQGRENQHD